MLKDRRDRIKLVVSLLLCQAAGGVGVLFSNTSLQSWYPQLAKPAFTPPSWVFGVVWPVLYLLMGVALYLVWRRKPLGREGETAVAWFFIQLGLNVAWTWFFFGLRMPRIAFFEVVLLWLAVLITTVAFFRLSKIAGLLLLPYLLWVSFATYLMYNIWQLN